MRSTHRLWIVLGVLCVLGMGSGCVHRSTLDGVMVQPLANPAHGPTVKIVKVTDSRKFEVDPENPQTPTLADKDQITNPAATARALGKAKAGIHRCYYSLPEGRTASTLVQAAVENALRTKGYTVVASNSPAAAGAIPVEVEVRRFWEWYTVEFWSVRFDCGLEVCLTSPVVVNGMAPATGDFNIHSQFLATGTFEAAAIDALDKLTAEFQPKLKDPK